MPGWVILPLRLFLGLSFLMAGLDKLTDPSFLDPAARGYIGQQISGFATGTPLEGFLLNIALPNATLFGVLVMGGEICIGIAALLGLLTRFSAAMGLLISMTFFLSVTWSVRPFYFGADLPYALGWLTLLLSGPGPFALDHVLKGWLQTSPEIAVGVNATTRAAQPETLLTRRAVLGAGVAGLAGTLIASTGLGWGLLHPRGADVAAQAGATAPNPIKPPVANTSPTTAAAPTQVAAQEPASPVQAPTQEPPSQSAPAQAANGVLVAAVGTVAVGAALDFVLPTGEPAVLVHNDAGYSAYVAICPHQGCTVSMSSSGVLRCPCHGAEFDPNANAKVLRGPARRPLSPVALNVAPDGSVYLAG